MSEERANHTGWQTWLTYSVLFASLWVLLTQGDMRAWLLGIVAVPLATVLAVRLFPSKRGPYQQLHLLALPRFLSFFFFESLKGAWYSALFAIVPSKSAKPGFISYEMHLPEGRSRLFFVNIISLLPGTVSSHWQDATLMVHVLDETADNHGALVNCEQHIARLFGVRL